MSFSKDNFKIDDIDENNVFLSIHEKIIEEIMDAYMELDQETTQNLILRMCMIKKNEILYFESRDYLLANYKDHHSLLNELREFKSIVKKDENNALEHLSYNKSIKEKLQVYLKAESFFNRGTPTSFNSIQSIYFLKNVNFTTKNIYFNMATLYMFSSKIIISLSKELCLVNKNKNIENEKKIKIIFIILQNIEIEKNYNKIIEYLIDIIDNEKSVEEVYDLINNINFPFYKKFLLVIFSISLMYELSNKKINNKERKKLLRLFFE